MISFARFVSRRTFSLFDLIGITAVGCITSADIGWGRWPLALCVVLLVAPISVAIEEWVRFRDH